jgi:hypothetical protein
VGPDHRGVVLGPYVWKPDPQGTCAPVPVRAARVRDRSPRYRKKATREEKEV